MHKHSQCTIIKSIYTQEILFFFFFNNYLLYITVKKDVGVCNYRDSLLYFVMLKINFNRNDSIRCIKTHRV